MISKPKSLNNNIIFRIGVASSPGILRTYPSNGWETRHTGLTTQVANFTLN